MEDWIVKLGEPDTEGNQPIVEKRELVRCKDCKYVTFQWKESGKLFCSSSNACGCHDPDWFCAGGERRKGMKMKWQD